MNTKFVSVVGALVLALGSAAMSVDAYAAEIPQMAASERLRAAASRLDLTAEQQEAMQVLMVARENVMKSARERIAANPSKKSLRGAYDLAQRGQKSFEKDAEKLLTREQRKAWKELRKEERAMLKDWHKKARKEM